MGSVHAIDRDGDEHTLEARAGYTLMEILRDGGLPIEAICGGQCICSTCHVYVDAAWAAGVVASAKGEEGSRTRDITKTIRASPAKYPTAMRWTAYA
jgi:ferredoxin, 2Fe-2S